MKQQQLDLDPPPDSVEPLRATLRPEPAPMSVIAPPPRPEPSGESTAALTESARDRRSFDLFEAYVAGNIARR